MKAAASSVTLNQSLSGGEYLAGSLGPSVAAFGFRKINPDYGGYALRVRRSTDNALLDVGFDRYGGFDVDAYLAFIGSANGFCVTLYDQSGGGRDVVQSTAASQPQIVFQDGECVLLCTGGDFLQNASFVGSLGGTFTLHISWKAPVTAPSGFLSQMGGIDWDAGQNFLSPWWTTIQHGAFYSNSVATTSQAGWEDGKWRQMTLKYEGGNASLFEFGVLTQEPIARVQPSWARLTIGKNDFGSGDFYFNELVLWPRSINPPSIYEIYKKNHVSLLATNSERLNVFLGDSNTTTLFCGLGRTWSKVASDAAGLNRWHTICQGGWTTQNLIDRRAEWTKYVRGVKRGPATLIIFLGTNDFVVDGLSASATFSRLKSLCQIAKSSGFNRTVLVTPLPRFLSGSANNLSFEPRRQELSNSMLADRSGDFDLVIDVRNLSIGVDGNQDTTTNYVADNVHLNATGQAILGNYVASFL